MATRLLPGVMQFDENDVLGLAALDLTQANEKISDSGTGDAGVLVTISNGQLGDPVTFHDPATAPGNYLGKDFNSAGLHVYGQSYPATSYTVKAADGSVPDFVVGLTLQQTAKYDENGEKLLYYREKARAMNIALPGETIRVATRGFFTIHESAVVTAGLTVGTDLGLADTGGADVGKFDVSIGSGGSAVGNFATIIGVGERTATGNPVTDPLVGTYYFIKLG